MAPKRNTSQTVAWTSLKEELQSAATLLHAQVEAGLDADETLEALFKSTKSRLGNIGDLGRAQTAELTQLINKGPWSSDQRRMLAAELSLTNTPTDDTKRLNRKNQTCSYFENFIPEHVWRFCRSNAPNNVARAQALARVGYQIHLVNPSSPTLFRMVAVVAYTANDYGMAQQEVFDLMDKIQHMLKAFPQHATPMSLTDYPVSALLLAPEILESAYENDPPPDVAIPELDTILAGKKQRGRIDPTKPSPDCPRCNMLASTSSQFTQPYQKPTQPHQHPTKSEQYSTQPHSTQQYSTQPNQKQYASSSSQFDARLDDLSTSLRALRENMLPGKVKLEAAPIKKDEYDESKKDEWEVKTDKHECDVNAEPTEEDEPSHGSLMEMELQMIQAAKSRANLMKKPATTTALKRPADALSPTTKPCKVEKEESTACKKFASTIDFEKVWASLDACRKEDGMYRNKYCSRAYAAAQKLAAGKTKNKSIINTFAKMQYRAAGKRWEASTCEPSWQRDDAGLTHVLPSSDLARIRLVWLGSGGRASRGLAWHGSF